MTTSGMWGQGWVQRAGGTPHSTDDATRWVQGHVLPPTEVEGVLRIGWLERARHLQVQSELYVPGTKELLAMTSIPHQYADSPLQAIDIALVELRSMWLAALDPEPFD